MFKIITKQKTVRSNTALVMRLKTTSTDGIFLTIIFNPNSLKYVQMKNLVNIVLREMAWGIEIPGVKNPILKEIQKGLKND